MKTQNEILLHPHAQIALRAARNVKSWGTDATARYVRNSGCPFSLYRLARQLEATKQ